MHTIFRLYLRLGDVRLVKAEADSLALRTKIRKSSNGRIAGGCRLSWGYIYKLLNNPIYVGRIRHRDQTCDGQHDAIIDVETWHHVQAKLANHVRGRDVTTSRTAPGPLAGKPFDASGRRLTPSHANKKSRRYRYDIFHHLISGTVKDADDVGNGWHQRAHEIKWRLSLTASGSGSPPAPGKLPPKAGRYAERARRRRQSSEIRDLVAVQRVSSEPVSA